MDIEEVIHREFIQTCGKYRRTHSLFPQINVKE